jgi:hypothetical protein
MERERERETCHSPRLPALLRTGGNGFSSGSGVHTLPGTPLVAMRSSRRTLTLVPLVALIFYDVSGGPFGVEDAVSSAGALLTIVGFIVLPLCWSGAGGVDHGRAVHGVSGELWVRSVGHGGVLVRDGDFWRGSLSGLSGVTDNALYPVIFFTYLEQVAPWMFAGSGWVFRG